MRLLRITLIFCAITLFFVGVVLLGLKFVMQGVNDGEWRNIVETGLPSRPSKFKWSAWFPNNGSVQVFRQFQPEHRPDALREYRVGRGKGFLFDFTCYQGRFERNSTMYEWPAIGPGWGATYNWSPLCFALTAGVCCLIAAHFATRSLSAISKV